MLASALGRYELQRPGQVAREVALVAESPDDGQVRCVQLGDAAVRGHHPGDVRAAEPQEGLPLSVRLSVGRLLDEARLEDVRWDEGLYVALWRGGADAWRREQALEQDEELEIVGAKEAREVGPRELGVADRAGPKTGEVETCRHWAKGWCMRADACRFAHPQPPVPRGVPQELLLILQAVARVGALSLDRSQGHGRGHGTLLQGVVVKAQGGGLPAVGYAVESGGLTEWAVALPCGMAALLTPFPVVPWRDMVTVQEANLGWVCTWHTHPAGMDPREWQA